MEVCGASAHPPTCLCLVGCMQMNVHYIGYLRCVQTRYMVYRYTLKSDAIADASFPWCYSPLTTRFSQCRQAPHIILIGRWITDPTIVANIITLRFHQHANCQLMNSPLSNSLPTTDVSNRKHTCSRLRCVRAYVCAN